MQAALGQGVISVPGLLALCASLRCSPLLAQGLPLWAQDAAIPSIVPSLRSGAFFWAISQALAPAQWGQQ